jgi:hypothetical protein
MESLPRTAGRCEGEKRMGTTEEGVKQAIENCLKVKKSEDVVVITVFL